MSGFDNGREWTLGRILVAGTKRPVSAAAVSETGSAEKYSKSDYQNVKKEAKPSETREIWVAREPISGFFRRANKVSERSETFLGGHNALPSLNLNVEFKGNLSVYEKVLLLSSDMPSVASSTQPVERDAIVDTSMLKESMEHSLQVQALASATVVSRFERELRN